MGLAADELVEIRLVEQVKTLPIWVSGRDVFVECVLAVGRHMREVEETVFLATDLKFAF